MTSILFAIRRQLPWHDTDAPTRVDASDDKQQVLIPMIQTIKQLQRVCERYPTHFWDLHPELARLTATFDRAARRPHGRKAKPSAIAKLEQSLEDLSYRCERRRRLVEGWMATATSMTRAESMTKASPVFKGTPT